MKGTISILIINDRNGKAQPQKDQYLNYVKTYLEIAFNELGLASTFVYCSKKHAAETIGSKFPYNYVVMGPEVEDSILQAALSRNYKVIKIVSRTPDLNAAAKWPKLIQLLKWSNYKQFLEVFQEL